MADQSAARGKLGFQWRWISLPLLPAVFALSVWSAAAPQQPGSTDSRKASTLQPRGVMSPPSISLTKTVGTVALACAATDEIAVVSGTQVTYCYRVVNTGGVTLTLHDLVDSELGVLLDDVAIFLPPTQAHNHLEATSITVTTLNTATWTAYYGAEAATVGGQIGPPSVSAVDTALVTILTPTPTATPTATPSATPTPTVEILPPVVPEIPTVSGVGATLLVLLLMAVAVLHLARARR